MKLSIQQGKVWKVKELNALSSVKTLGDVLNVVLCLSLSKIPRIPYKFTSRYAKGQRRLIEALLRFFDNKDRFFFLKSSH